MFVSKARYNALERELEKLKAENLGLEYRCYDYSNRARKTESKYDNLVNMHNTLVRQLNAKGGKELLNRGLLLAEAEIKSLLSLVHPDKHGGKESAVRWTQKLLEMRDTP